MVMRRACKAIAKGGGPCRAAPLRDGDFCRMHSPHHTKEVTEARRLGGLRRRREVTIAGAYEFEGLEDVSQIRRLLEVATLDTLSLENSIARARALAYFAQTALKLLEVGEMEERLAALETVIAPRVPAKRGQA